RLQLYTRWRWLLAGFVSLSLVSALFTFWYPMTGMRVFLAPAAACLVMSHIALILVRSGREPRLAQWVAAAIIQLFALTQGLAAVIAVNLGDTPGGLVYELYHMVNFGLMPTLFIAMGISVIFLLATDLATRLADIARIDSLTGVSNRRGFLEASESARSYCGRIGKPLSLLLADIDHFKCINDRYGHSAGDQALIHFATVLRESLRTEDVLGRIGGEEFAVILSGKSNSEAEVVAARFRAALRQRPARFGNVEITMSASFGIAQWQENDDIGALFKRADQALYQAKGAGRDAVFVAPMLAEVPATMRIWPG
ncbi:MAG: GGDEF domain-containing protein, partial [Parahaliea sp.]